MAVMVASGTYLPRGLTFGPTNGPEDFQELVFIVFSRWLYRKWFLFLDDLAIATGRPESGNSEPSNADDVVGCTREQHRSCVPPRYRRSCSTMGLKSAVWAAGLVSAETASLDEFIQGNAELPVVMLVAAACMLLISALLLSRASSMKIASVTSILLCFVMLPSGCSTVQTSGKTQTSRRTSSM